MITSSTSDETILPNAAPMMMPTAMSITNSLNSLSTVFLLFASMKAKDGPVPIRLAGSGRLVFERGLHPRREKIERHRNKRTKEAARARATMRLADTRVEQRLGSTTPLGDVSTICALAR